MAIWRSSLEKVELIMNNRSFWNGKKVFVTGHTGFKGSWLCLWLHSLGAEVTGYALNPPTQPSLFELCHIDQLIDSKIADIRDLEKLRDTMRAVKPEIVFHMAAQPLVRDSYKIPVETYAINVMGTVHLLEAVRQTTGIRAVVNITTDKCYENKEWCWGYRENEPMGGYDPYSNSKGCSELVTSAYRNSFFNVKNYLQHGVGLATARAGNVIGGGDWATDRLIPDIFKALLQKEIIKIRNPRAIRPWQHVLEPLSGYMILAQKLFEHGPEYAEGWNFGPNDNDAKEVEWIVKKICEIWGQSASYEIHEENHLYEANYLKLDCSKAKMKLGWSSNWNIETTLEQTIEWLLDYHNAKDLRNTCFRQIEEYSK